VSRLENETTPQGSSRWMRLFYSTAALVGALSVMETRLAVFAVLLLVIALASWSSSTRKHGRVSGNWTLILSISLALATLGLGRFIFKEALPGISEARGRDSEKRAVSLLREIYFAENAMRRYAMIDPDHDQIGGAGRLSELTGQTAHLSSPPLAPRLQPRMSTAQGPATEHEGYLVLVCVPGPNGTWTARPDDAVDEEARERNWVAYAWPSAAHLPHSRAFAIDQHERIIVSDNHDERGLVFVGATYPPPCGPLDSLPNRAKWVSWQGKLSRSDLPGDHR